MSYAVDRSTKAVSVIMFFGYPSSICWVIFSSWLVYDLPGMKPTCSLIRCSMVGAILLSIIFVECVHVTQEGYWSVTL